MTPRFADFLSHYGPGVMGPGLRQAFAGTTLRFLNFLSYPGKNSANGSSVVRRRWLR
jgi:hypothetical protein